MFGYLNLGNPKYIGETESQEFKNCRIDQGYLEYSSYPTNSLNGRSVLLPNGRTVTMSAAQSRLLWAKPTGTPAAFGLDKPDEIINNIAAPATTISRMPVITAAAYGSQPYAAGDYAYGVTLYDPDTEEESIPAMVDLTVGTNEVANFASFPAVNNLFPGRANLQWRIYRMPIGGSELLLVNHATVLSANAAITSYQDIVEDYNLGVLCESTDNGIEPLRSGSVESIILFNDILFVGGAGYADDDSASTRVMFSKQGKWWAFPQENELNIPASTGRAFRGFAILNETLVMIGEKGIYVLYGDNVDNFSKKDIEFQFDENWPAANGSKAAGGLVAFPVIGNETYYKNPSDGYTGLKYIAGFDGGKVKVISDKIKNLLPLAHNTSFITSDCALIDNRFYALKLIDVKATYESTESPTAADSVYITLVLDMYSLGWGTADDSGKFYYRTKEFSEPRNVQFHKTAWVEAVGDFTIETYGDGRLITRVAYIVPTKRMIYFNVKPHRYSNLSFRFIGEQNCKIYDYGVEK